MIHFQVRACVEVIVLLCCLGQSLRAQTTADSNFSMEKLVFTASKVYSLLHCYFYSAEEAPDPSVDVSYKHYLRTVLASDDRHQFDLASMEFVAQRHNGHTFFWDAGLDKNNQQPLGFYAAPLGGYWVVQTSVLVVLHLTTGRERFEGDFV